MKLLTFDEFVRLPPGAIYSHYEPHVTHGMYRKGYTILNDDGEPIDFYEVDLEPDCDHAANGDRTVTFEANYGRWGLYDRDMMYAVYEPGDVARLVRLLLGEPHEADGSKA